MKEFRSKVNGSTEIAHKLKVFCSFAGIFRVWSFPSNYVHFMYSICDFKQSRVICTNQILPLFAFCERAKRQSQIFSINLCLSLSQKVCFYFRSEIFYFHALRRGSWFDSKLNWNRFNVNSSSASFSMLCIHSFQRNVTFLYSFTRTNGNWTYEKQHFSLINCSNTFKLFAFYFVVASPLRPCFFVRLCEVRKQCKFFFRWERFTCTWRKYANTDWNGGEQKKILLSGHHISYYVGVLAHFTVIHVLLFMYIHQRKATAATHPNPHIQTIEWKRRARKKANTIHRDLHQERMKFDLWVQKGAANKKVYVDHGESAPPNMGYSQMECLYLKIMLQL